MILGVSRSGFGRVRGGELRVLYSDFLWFSAEFCGETELGTGLNGAFAG